MELKYILKKKRKRKSELDEKLSLKQRLAIHSLQKQMQIISLKEYLVLSSFIIGAALLRIPMQAFPSVEPLTFFAVLSGWLFGKKKGFIAGATSLYISNFFMFGGQGPWTLFQALGFGIGGYLGGFLRKKATVLETLGIMVLATIIFEITMNISSSFFMGFNVMLAFMTALPFTITHIISNGAFSFGLPYAKKLVNKAGGFNEKEICLKLINKIKRVKKEVEKRVKNEMEA